MGTLALMLVLFASPLPARWWKADSGTLTVYSDSSQSQAKETLEHLELATRVFSSFWPGRNATPFPVVAYALSSDARFQALRPAESTRGFYQSAPQRDYIVLHAASTEKTRITMHESFHMVLNHTIGPLPQWLEEGLAEFYSTIENQGSRVRVGRPIPNHLRTLAERKWMSAADLAAVSKVSSHYSEQAQAGLFYAQSWAMVHMLRLGEKHRGGWTKFLAAVEAGESQPAAFQRVYGQSSSEVLFELQRYLARPSLPVAEYAVEAVRNTAGAQIRELPDRDGDLAYAELAMDTGHPEEAEKIYRKLARGPQSASTAAVLGMLAVAEKKPEEAKAYFEKALEFPEAPAAVHFEYAMLLRQLRAPKEDMNRSLREAVRVNPQFAEAHFLLGVDAANENRHEEAREHIQKAVAIFPRQSYFWHAMAISCHALGMTEEARNAAQRALDSAANPEQVEMARAALRLGATPETAKPTTRPSVITPDSWKNKQGDARVEGVLERIDCLGASARFHVRAGSRVTALFVENPGEVLLKNLSSITFEFRCGPQKPTAVVIEYQAKPSVDHGTVGVVTGIEFR